MGSTLQANNGQTGLCLPLHSYSRSASHAPQTFPLVDPSVPGSLFLSFIMSARFLIYCSSRYRWKSLPNIHCSLLRGILRLKVTLLNLCPSSWLFFFFPPPRREFYALLFLTILQSEADCKLTQCFDQLSKNLIIDTHTLPQGNTSRQAVQPGWHRFC